MLLRRFLHNRIASQRGRNPRRWTLGALLLLLGARAVLWQLYTSLRTPDALLGRAGGDRSGLDPGQLRPESSACGPPFWRYLPKAATCGGEQRC